MNEQEEKQALIRRANRLARMVEMGVPDWLLAREFFLVERSVRNLVDDKVIGDAKFAMESDPSWDDGRIRGVG